VRLVPLDTFVDAPKRSEIAVTGAPLGHRAFRRQLGGSDARTPFVDVAEVVEDFPHRFNGRTNLTSDCEFWQLSIPPHAAAATPGLGSRFRIVAFIGPTAMEVDALPHERAEDLLRRREVASQLLVDEAFAGAALQEELAGLGVATEEVGVVHVSISDGRWRGCQLLGGP